LCRGRLRRENGDYSGFSERWNCISKELPYGKPVCIPIFPMQIYGIINIIFLDITQTIGVEYTVKQIPIPNSNAIVELHIYDCGGQSIFSNSEINKQYVGQIFISQLSYDGKTCFSGKMLPL